MIKQIELLSRPQVERALAEARNQQGRIDVSRAFNSEDGRALPGRLATSAALSDQKIRIGELEEILVDIGRAERDLSQALQSGHVVIATYPLDSDRGVTLILAND